MNHEISIISAKRAQRCMQQQLLFAGCSNHSVVLMLMSMLLLLVPLLLLPHLFWADEELPALPVALHDACASATAAHGRAHILCLAPTFMLAFAACICLLLLLPCRGKQQNVCLRSLSYIGTSMDAAAGDVDKPDASCRSTGTWAGTLIRPFPCNRGSWWAPGQSIYSCIYRRDIYPHHMQREHGQAP
jgi:hypothetical protein